MIYRHPAGQLLIEHRHGDDLHPQFEAIHEDLQQIAVNLVRDSQDECCHTLLSNQALQRVTIPNDMQR